MRKETRSEGGWRGWHSPRALRHPALHFLVLGSLLFFAEGWLAGGAESGAQERRVLKVGPERFEHLSRQWQALRGTRPTPAEEDELIGQWIEDEILYREALAMGFDRGNRGVCHRLVLNMSFLGLADEMSSAALQRDGPNEAWWTLCEKARELGLDRDDPVIRRQLATVMRTALRQSHTADKEVSRAEIEDYVERHQERFSSPPRIRLNHVFLSRDRRGDALESDANHLLERLVAEAVDPERAPALGDPWPMRALPRKSSRRDLERRLGKVFAGAVVELPENRWSGPVSSSFGLHLVWVHEHLPGALEPWERIEARALRELKSQRREEQYAAALERLRGLWQVSIEPPERDAT